MRLLHALALLAIAGCAPDAWRPDPGYNAFLNAVQNGCPYFRIGLAGSDALFADSRFLDDTSRLYHGVITPAAWKSSMQGMYNANPDDPGMACLLSKLPAPGAAGGDQADPAVAVARPRAGRALPPAAPWKLARAAGAPAPRPTRG